MPVAQLEPAWFHRHVALVGQEPVLFARSIGENICYGLAADEAPTQEQARVGCARGPCAAAPHRPATFLFCAARWSMRPT